MLLDEQGRLLCGVEGGAILCMDADGSNACEVLNTGGRPLGLEWLPDGRVLVCDSQRGLLAIDLERAQIDVLVQQVGGADLLVCNNPAVARDGTIYFSDSSRRYRLDDIRVDVIEHVATGRLLRRNPDGSVEVLADGLYFANGVVLAPDESFVLVAETGASRIRRLWLEGPRRGALETFVDNLPGLPDNLSLGSDGLFWLALPMASDPLLKLVHRLPLALRRWIKHIPERLQPPPTRNALFMAFDRHGEVAHFLEADPLRFHLPTGVRERNGELFAGSVEGDKVAVLHVPNRPGAR